MPCCCAERQVAGVVRARRRHAAGFRRLTKDREGRCLSPRGHHRTRPATCSTQAETTVEYSANVKEKNSPVPPAGKMAAHPLSSSISTSAASAFVSISPSELNGVKQNASRPDSEDLSSSGLICTSTFSFPISLRCTCDLSRTPFCPSLTTAQHTDQCSGRKRSLSHSPHVGIASFKRSMNTSTSDAVL